MAKESSCEFSDTVYSLEADRTLVAYISRH